MYFCIFPYLCFSIYHHLFVIMYNSMSAPVCTSVTGQTAKLSTAQRKPTILHCTGLHCIALHSTPVHCTVMHCTSVHGNVMHCMQ